MQKKYETTKCYEETLTDCIDGKLFISNSRLVLLCQSVRKNTPLAIFTITYQYGKFQTTALENICLDINSDLNGESAYGESAYQNSIITKLNELLVVTVGDDLLAIDIVKKSIVCKMSYKSLKSQAEYFTRLNKIGERFIRIDNSDDLVSINTSNQLVYIECTKSKFNLIMSKLNNSKYTRVETKHSVLCGYDEKGFCLNIFDKVKCIKDSFNKTKFKVTFKNNLLNDFVISENAEYLLSFELKVISLHRIKDGTRIAHVPMYSEILAISISTEYVAIAMQDRRIVTLLLTDPQKPDNIQRIKALESRYTFELKSFQLLNK